MTDIVYSHFWCTHTSIQKQSRRPVSKQSACHHVFPVPTYRGPLMAATIPSGPSSKAAYHSEAPSWPKCRSENAMETRRADVEEAVRILISNIVALVPGCAWSKSRFVTKLKYAQCFSVHPGLLTERNAGHSVPTEVICSKIDVRRYYRIR